MQITAKTHFVHGALTLKKGDTADIPDQTAKELQAAGLVDFDGDSGLEAKQALTPKNKMALEPDNKTVHQPIQEATTKN
jgi:hypothetical protein